MTHDLKALRELEKRLAEAKGPDRVTDFYLAALTDKQMADDLSIMNGITYSSDGEFVLTFKAASGALGRGFYGDHMAPPATASLDAAVALVERVLPNIAWRVTKKLDGKCYALLQRLDEDVEGGFDIWAESKDFPTAPLAMCAALLTALIAQGEQ